MALIKGFCAEFASMVAKQDPPHSSFEQWHTGQRQEQMTNEMYYDLITNQQVPYRGILISQTSYLAQIGIQHAFKVAVESIGHKNLGDIHTKPEMKGLFERCMKTNSISFNTDILKSHVDFVGIGYYGLINVDSIQLPA